MNRKIVVFIEKNIVGLAERRAAEEGWSLSDLIQDALAQYLQTEARITAEERKRAYRLFCEQPMKIPPEQLRYLLDEDMWNK